MNTTGIFDQRFLALESLFYSHVEAQSEGGAAFSVFVHGREVVRLHAGQARPGMPWESSTLSLAFSCTKGITALIVGQLIERGELDSELPVSHYWSEFSAISSTLTVRELMEHKAGLSAVREDLSLQDVLDHGIVIDKLFSQGPLWEPGAGYAYHAFTFGNLVDELVLRVTGKRVSALLQERIAEPLNIEAWIGLPPEQEERVTLLTSSTPSLVSPVAPGSPQDLNIRALSFGTAFPAERRIQAGEGFNLPEVHQASLPGVNLITSASALAKIWSATVTPTDGVRLVSDDTVKKMTQLTVSGPSVWNEPGPWPNRGLGVMLNTPERNPLLSPSGFGHDGFGGQAGFADPTYKASFAYLTNNLVLGEKEHSTWSDLLAETRKILTSG